MENKIKYYNKLSVKEKNKIYKELLNDLTITEIAIKYNITNSSVNKVILSKMKIK